MFAEDPQAQDAATVLGAQPRLYEAVVDRLLDLVEARRLAPGQALPTERELASELSVSRNVLRQAFGVLEERGLIATRRGAGRYLRQAAPGLAASTGRAASLQVASIADVLEARMLLEEQVVALACQRRTAEEARELMQLADRLTSWEDNLAFHAAIAAAAHNFMLQRLVREQAELLGELRQREHYADQDELERMRREHGEIATAVAARDDSRAQRLVRGHLERTRDVVYSSAAQPQAAGMRARAEPPDMMNQPGYDTT